MLSPSVTFHTAQLRTGVTLRYAAQGASDAPAVLMLHGVTDSWFSFSRVLSLLPPDVRAIVPDQRGVKPRYGEKHFASKPAGALHLVASKSGREDSIAINQDADLHLARLNPNDTVEHKLSPGRHAWVHVATGEVAVNGQVLKAGDAAALSEEARVKLAARQPSQVLLFDLN